MGPNDPPLTAEEKEYLERVGKWAEAEGAYIAIQATKPLTLAYALTDSPAGLAAWYVEKFRSWSDCQAEPDEILSKDEMITDIMVHWLTGTAHSAMRSTVNRASIHCTWPPASASSPRVASSTCPENCPCHRAAGRSELSTSCTGRSCHAEDISPHGKCQNCSRKIFAPSSDRYVRARHLDGLEQHTSH